MNRELSDFAETYALAETCFRRALLVHENACLLMHKINKAEHKDETVNTCVRVNLRRAQEMLDASIDNLDDARLAYEEVQAMSKAAV